MPTKSKKKRLPQGRHRLGMIIVAVMLPVWAVPACAEDGSQARSQPKVLAEEGWEDWLDQWWVEPELEWDDTGDGVDLSIDAEIGHMLTERLGVWGRPAYHADDGGETEDWDLRFGIRYRLN